MMETVFVVLKSFGKYELESVEPFKAYKDYDRAKEECNKINDYVDGIQKNFDKINNIEIVETNIRKVGRFLYQEQYPKLFNKLIDVYDSGTEEDIDNAEEMYYSIIHPLENEVFPITFTATVMKKFTDTEIKEMEAYLMYRKHTNGDSVYDYLPHYFVSKDEIELDTKINKVKTNYPTDEDVENASENAAYDKGHSNRDIEFSQYSEGFQKGVEWLKEWIKNE